MAKWTSSSILCGDKWQFHTPKGYTEGEWAWGGSFNLECAMFEALKNTQPPYQEQLEILTRVYGPSLDSQPTLWLETLWGPQLTGQAMSLGEVPRWELGE